MRDFQLKATVRENVLELMRVLGTVERPLSLRGLARQISARHPSKKGIDYKMVERWVREDEPVEPDILSIAIMALMADVPFEKFALGKGATPTDVRDRIQAADGTAPVAQGFQRMSSKELEAAAKKRRKRRA